MRTWLSLCSSSKIMLSSPSVSANLFENYIIVTSSNKLLVILNIRHQNWYQHFFFSQFWIQHAFKCANNETNSHMTVMWSLLPPHHQHGKCRHPLVLLRWWVRYEYEPWTVLLSQLKGKLEICEKETLPWRLAVTAVTVCVVEINEIHLPSEVDPFL